MTNDPPVATPPPRPRDYQFELPEALIAQMPPEVRGASRLLLLDGASGACRDAAFADLPGLLRPGDLLVRNITRVLPARVRGTKDTGGRFELMLERVLGERRALVQLRASKPPLAGRRLNLPGGAVATVVGVGDGFVEIELDRPVAAYLEAHGEMPLPPYVRRCETSTDRERYQTVYASEPGAVAAPTAGLHFDAAIFAALASRGVAIADVTLHVGAGTFQPLRPEQLEGRQLHAERVEVPPATVAAVARARAAGGRVVAVGTTVVRALESASASGVLHEFSGETRLFIYPGFRFRIVDAMVTNFHLPGSSLLMLVSAFAGRDHVLAAYAHAVAGRYRFFSYGDAMFVTPAAGVRQ